MNDENLISDAELDGVLGAAAARLDDALARADTTAGLADIVHRTESREAPERVPALVGARRGGGSLARRHMSMVLVDVEKSGNPARIDGHQLETHQGLYGVLEQAFASSHVPWKRCETEDRGDGAMVLVPSDVSKNRLAAVLPGQLLAALERHNSSGPPEARVRLRMALHAGEVHSDALGHFSDSLNVGFRLLDNAETKKALRGSSGLLAVTVSDLIYQDVIRHDINAFPQEYRRIEFSRKEKSATAWVRIPGELLRLVVDALEQVPALRDPLGRELCLDLLTHQLGFTLPIQHFDITRPHLISIVLACRTQRVLSTFLDVVDVVQPHSLAVDNVRRILAAMRGEPSA